MSDITYNPSATPAWQALNKLAAGINEVRILNLLSDSERVGQYSLSTCGISLDYSKNLVTDEVLGSLFDLARQSPLETHRAAMFAGEKINTTEQRPVLHAALRATESDLEADGLANLWTGIAEQKQRIREVSEKIRSGNWLGTTGKPITEVVNLGIGGSDLGPRMVCEALKEYAQPGITCHFVSNVDGEEINSTLKSLDPEQTLVIISSKTFTTQETLLNARTAAKWFSQQLGLENPFNSPHFIGVTAAPQNAVKLGVPAENLLEFWDWVGGRYSLWSTIGLSVAIAAGADNFEKLLDGARAMDQHFRSAPLEQNMPVILALLGIWYSNFLQAESHAVIPYCERLFYFPFYLQQLDMESNGKRVTLGGEDVTWQTGPILWGLTGTNGQHSFFQLLHQGTHLIPVDFIATLRDKLSDAEHHRVLLANMLAQSAALMTGKQDPELPSWRFYPGNRPSNVMLLEELTPQSLGALVALYEHKVFVQGCIWNVNSYDQWGVELGKVLAGNLLREDCDRDALDSSTRKLLEIIDASANN